MVELIAVIFIGIFFYNTAKKKSKPPVGWTILGILSYYVPIFMLNLLIWGTLGVRSAFLVMVINIIVGIVCALAFKRKMLDN